ncbi:MAG: peptidoglycan bridge formation glycyltransferase FemA/FemB family protein, partial [Anaerolineaceae bacterium]|nr:peptidoglycan bridge formation glycyltransferase FemA/FemB family protein [Anaerolineaceae bacterium]
MFPLSEAEIRNWDKLLLKFPNAHILQTSQWAEAKAQNGWQPLYFWSGKSLDAPEALALILKRQVSFLGLKFTVLYCPKGPVLDWENAQLVEEKLQFLQDFAKKEKAIFVKIDPDVQIGTGESGEDDLRIPERLEARGWCFSQDQIQFRNTVLIDLNQSEDELLGAMKQKTRYNIRLAAKKGVIVREGKVDELPMLYKMYAETAVRDDFVIRG